QNNGSENSGRMAQALQSRQTPLGGSLSAAGNGVWTPFRSAAGSTRLEGMDPVVPLIVVGALVALVAVGCAAIRVVPAGHCGVVFRLGRPVRHRPTGLVAMLPGVERLDLVPLSPRTIEPLPVQVQTRDG